MSERWKVGDRCIVGLRNQHEWRRIETDVAGVVVEVDPPGLPRGVRVEFTKPAVFNGLRDCFATHEELRRP